MACLIRGNTKTFLFLLDQAVPGAPLGSEMGNIEKITT